MNDVNGQDGPRQDPIVAEVRAVRAALFAASGSDIREFCRRLREEQVVSGHLIVTCAPQSNQQPALPDPASKPSRRAG